MSRARIESTKNCISARRSGNTHLIIGKQRLNGEALMTLATTAAFFRRLMRLRRLDKRRDLRSDEIDPADMGTAFGLESTMMSPDETPLVRRLSAKDRALLHPRQR